MRVLIVEDEPELRRVTARSLREDGYAVDEAADGEEGLYKAKTWQYDAVILDIMLPKMHGWDVLTRFRKTHKTPVLVLTARDSIDDRVRGLDGGADDYLVKPFDLSELLARLRSLIRRSAGQAASVMEFGDIAIDSKAKRVTNKGEDTGLTAREYAIVEMLALRRGQVVSRTEIYEHIFDENDESVSNLLDVHVAHIRNKLGKDFIQTRRGMGYVIDG
jgi:two-component system, OmpR family, response regulator